MRVLQGSSVGSRTGARTTRAPLRAIGSRAINGTILAPHQSMTVTRLRQALAAEESRLIREAIRETCGDVRAAARLLDIPERTLWYKIHKLGILRKDFIVEQETQ